MFLLAFGFGVRCNQVGRRQVSGALTKRQFKLRTPQEIVYKGNHQKMRE